MEKIYKLYTDGSNQTYKKLAGYGGYIEDEFGTKIISFSEVISNPLFNNKHELLGLKRGLELAIKENIDNIICYTDDLNMAKLINTNDLNTLQEFNLKPLHKEVIDLKKYFKNIEIKYIPRKQNSEADKLSRKALKKYIIENNINGIPNKDYFRHEKFITKNQFENKEKFSKLIEKIENYIVFSEIASNKMDIYLLKKDVNTNEIKHELIESINLKKNNQQEMLEIISWILNKNTELKECCFFSISAGNKSQIIEGMLRGQGYITPSIKETIINFEKTINKFDRVFYHREQKIINYLHSLIAKQVPSIAFEASPENIIKALKELGEDDYYLGKNPQIEEPTKIKEGQDSIVELQKYYFGKFMKLAMKETTQLNYKLSKEQKDKIIQDKMQSMRENLINQGIKLKM